MDEDGNEKCVNSFKDEIAWEMADVHDRIVSNSNV